MLKSVQLAIVHAIVIKGPNFKKFSKEIVTCPELNRQHLSQRKLVLFPVSRCCVKKKP